MEKTNRLQLIARCEVLPKEEAETLWIKLLIDEEKIVEFDYYSVDLDAIFQSLQKNGEFFILTCSCGSPGCAGIEDGFQITHKENLIYWKVSEPKKCGFVFDRKQYEAEIRKVIRQSKQLLFEAKYSKRVTPKIVPRQNQEYFDFNKRY